MKESSLVTPTGLTIKDFKLRYYRNFTICGVLAYVMWSLLAKAFIPTATDSIILRLPAGIFGVFCILFSYTSRWAKRNIEIVYLLFGLVTVFNYTYIFSYNPEQTLYSLGYMTVCIVVLFGLENRAYITVFLLLSSLFLWFPLKTKPIIWLNAIAEVGTLSFFYYMTNLHKHKVTDLLLKTDDRNTNLLDSFPGLIVRLDLKGRLVDFAVGKNFPINFNTAAERGNNFLYIFRDILTAQSIKAVEDLARQVVQTHQTQSASFLTADNNYFLEFIVAAKGEKEALLIVSDITAQKLLNEHERRLTKIGAIAAQVAHDIRAPLTALSIFNQSKVGHPLTIEEAQILGLATKRIQSIADDLLTRYKNIEATLPTKEFDAIPAIREVIEEKTSSHPGVIIYNPKIPEFFIRGNKSQFQRAVSNILNNAIESRPNKENLKIQIESAQESDQTFTLTIRDNGRGISPEKIPTIFSPGTSSGKFAGTGLGLAGAKKILNEMGLDIQLSSHLGMGTEVTITASSSRTPQASIPVNG